jgi:hypothetical protein
LTGIHVPARFDAWPDDNLAGTQEADEISGLRGDDRVRGLRGADLVSGGLGHDVLLGQRGRDLLFGGAGHDVLRGGKDADEAHDGRGSDWLTLGSGDDVAYTRVDGQWDKIICGSGEDQVWYWGDPDPKDQLFRCEHGSPRELGLRGPVIPHSRGFDPRPAARRW